MIRLCVALIVTVFVLASSFKTHHKGPSFSRWEIGAGDAGASPQIKLPPPLRSAPGTGAQLNAEITGLFVQPHMDMEKKMRTLQEIVARNSESMNHVHACTLLQRCAKAKKSAFAVVDPLLILVAMERDGRKAGNFWNGMDLSGAIFGLRCMSMGQPGVKRLVEVILIKLAQFRANGFQFSGPELASCFFGLQNLSNGQSEITQVNQLLDFLVEELERCETILGSREISNIIFGLRSFTHRNALVVKAVSLIRDKVAQAGPNLRFSAQGISTALNGFREMSASESPEVRRLLVDLLPHIRTPLSPLPNDQFTPIAVGSSLMGLRSTVITSDGFETEDLRQVLTAIAERIEGMPSGVYIDDSSLASAFHGLRNMDDSVSEVRRVVAALNNRIDVRGSPPTPSSGQYIGTVLNSLQKMSNDQEETRRTLSLMAFKLQRLEGAGKVMNLADASKAVAGFARTRSMSIEVLQIFGLLAKQIGSTIDSAAVAQVPDPTKGPLFSAASILYGLRYKSREAEVFPEIRALLRQACFLIEATPVTVLSARPVSHRPSPQWLSMCMQALEKTDPGIPEVQGLLAALSDRLAVLQLDGHAVSSALRSLNGMSSSDATVRVFLSSLAKTIRAARISAQSGGGAARDGVFYLSPDDLCNAFFGLQNMDIAHVEVVQVLCELVALGESMPTQSGFSSQGLGFALTGFQTMTSDEPAVLAALAQFSDRIDALGTETTMIPEDIANALLGLQGMNAEQEEVRAVLSALTSHMQRSTLRFSARDISFCLIGLTSIQKMMQASIQEVSELLAELNLKVSTSSLKGQPLLEFQISTGKHGEIGGYVKNP